MGPLIRTIARIGHWACSPPVALRPALYVGLVREEGGKRNKYRPQRAGGCEKSRDFDRQESTQAPAPIIFAISRQDLAHSRHDLAQAAIFASSACFSHSSAHISQHSAQHTHAGPANGLLRAVSVAANLQHSAQSAQSWTALACSFLPPSSIVKQCLKHESHCNWQPAQIVAHFMKCSACSPSPGAVCRARATSPDAMNDRLDNIFKPPKGISRANRTTCAVGGAKCGNRHAAMLGACVLQRFANLVFGFSHQRRVE
jgi:hypothetical protein